MPVPVSPSLGAVGNTGFAAAVTDAKLETSPADSKAVYLPLNFLNGPTLKVYPVIVTLVVPHVKMRVIKDSGVFKSRFAFMIG